VTLQWKVVTLPATLEPGLEVHVVTPDVPDTVQVTVPDGAAAPAVPVTVALKLKVELSAPVPLPVSAMSGDAFAIFTTTGELGPTPL